MTRLLRGDDLAAFIKERQAKQVRALRQAHGVHPTLAIVMSDQASPVIATYVRMKQRYGSDILVEVLVKCVQQADMPRVLDELNHDRAVHGIIVQLPLDDPAQTDEIVELIQPDKDVDGLGPQAAFSSATAEAIQWLIAGYGIDLAHKTIAIVGNGRLVGRPLAQLWRSSGYDVTVITRQTADITGELRHAEVIVTATGAPRSVTAAMVMPGAVVVDAGTASENGDLVGDLAPDVRQRDDLTITPEKGGVGPLTIAVLFDHVIQAASRSTNRRATDPELL